VMNGHSRSPAETSVRLGLVDAGFPTPQPLAATAIGYDAPKVGIEFGNGTSRFDMQAGWTMISATDVRNPHIIVCLVRMAVIERGYPLWRLERVAGRRA